MSFWFYKGQRRGRHGLFSVDVSIPLVVGLLALTIGLGLALLAWLGPGRLDPNRPSAAEGTVRASTQAWICGR